uniref:Short neuropeptide F receptor n=1 Tax=Thaumetopoea pityocampa TaxID=208016 RepID=A0A7D7PAQ3_THAPI|nr:short neuropeptide F receptor [Thaumetopoea pityocampa]
MFFNESKMGGSVLIITKTLIGESVALIEDPKDNKTTDLIDITLVQVGFCILYTVIFVLGVFGNVLVCYVVFRNKAMQTVTNLYITNLALSDILLCIFAVPLTPMYTFLGRWIFGRLLCHLMPYAQGISVYISTLTLTSIAVDRFFVIVFPFHPRMTLNKCIYIIIFIWVFSLVVTCPYGLYMGIQTTNNSTFYCEESWPSDKSRKIFGVFTTVLQFLLPFIIIAICYICVCIKLNDRARSKPGVKNTKREEADRDRKRRTNRMLISMVAIFGISWLPLNLINIFNDFYAQMTEWSYYFVSFFFAHSMAMASTCYNPILYAWLNDNFRKEFKQVLPFFESTGGGNNYHTGHIPAHRADKVCNGNDTTRETLLTSSFNRGPSIKQRSIKTHKKKGNRPKIENISIEDKTVSATFHAENKNVNFHLINEEAQLSGPTESKFPT